MNQTTLVTADQLTTGDIIKHRSDIWQVITEPEYTEQGICFVVAWLFESAPNTQTVSFVPGYLFELVNHLTLINMDTNLTQLIHELRLQKIQAQRDGVRVQDHRRQLGIVTGLDIAIRRLESFQVSQQLHSNKLLMPSLGGADRP